ncbi:MULTISPECIES: hypothetical protein [unclassified Brachybacterium]|uniref:hypothetical protein n=2 Tax=unclassified Brachybacterium TaxID=2623841 RepID=UPI003F91A0BE
MSLHTTLDTRSPTTIHTTDTSENTTSPIDTLTRRESSRADTSLRRLEQVADEDAVDTLLKGFLARRRAVREARRQQAAQQARHEHELLVQRALLGTGLSHLR